jgi:hypothetical protein
MSSVDYSFSNKESFIYDDIKAELFCFSDLQTKINDSMPIRMNGKYFPVKYGMQYGHLLLDFIGTFLYLKKKEPDLQLIFFNFEDKKPNKVCDDLIKHFNAKMIYIKKENYIFEKFYFFYIDDVRNVPDWWIDTNVSNFFIPPIPSGLFLDNFYAMVPFSEEYNIYRSTAVKELCNEFFKYRVPSDKINLYIDKNRSNFSNASEQYRRRRDVPEEYKNSLTQKIIDLGYTSMIIDSMGFFEQINLFYNAKRLVSFDGTLFLNAIWCDTDTEIVRIISNPEYNYNWSHIISSGGKENIKIIDIRNLDPIYGIPKILNSL